MYYHKEIEKGNLVEIRKGYYEKFFPTDMTDDYFKVVKIHKESYNPCFSKFELFNVDKRIKLEKLYPDYYLKLVNV